MVDVLENSIQPNVTVLLISEDMHSALPCLYIYLNSYSALVLAFLLSDLRTAFAHGGDEGDGGSRALEICFHVVFFPQLRNS